MTSDPPPLTDVERIARDWLVRVQLGDASGPEETGRQRMEALRQFEAWKQADRAHAAAADRMQRVMRATQFGRSSQIVAASRIRRRSVLSRHAVLSGAAAAICLAALGGSLAYRSISVGAGQGAPAATADLVYATPFGETHTVALPDGSTILLDADSLLRVRYSPQRRWVRLDRGRARFTVVHDAARPFLVDAGDATVVDLGTVFDVAVNVSGVRVTLLRGSIAVMPHDSRAAGDPGVRHLTPGQELRFTHAATMSAPRPAAAGAGDWVAGHLAFDDVLLADAVADINRYNRQQIVIGHNVRGDLRVTGGFEARAPRAFAIAVAAVLRLHVLTEPDGTLVLLPGGATGAH